MSAMAPEPTKFAAQGNVAMCQRAASLIRAMAGQVCAMIEIKAQGSIFRKI
jgi:hypothetical protein